MHNSCSPIHQPVQIFGHVPLTTHQPHAHMKRIGGFKNASPKRIDENGEIMVKVKQVSVIVVIEFDQFHPRGVMIVQKLPPSLG